MWKLKNRNTTCLNSLSLGIEEGLVQVSNQTIVHCWTPLWHPTSSFPWSCCVTLFNASPSTHVGSIQEKETVNEYFDVLPLPTRYWMVAGSPLAVQYWDVIQVEYSLQQCVNRGCGPALWALWHPYNPNIMPHCEVLSFVLQLLSQIGRQFNLVL